MTNYQDASYAARPASFDDDSAAFAYLEDAALDAYAGGASRNLEMAGPAVPYDYLLSEYQDSALLPSDSLWTDRHRRGGWLGCVLGGWLGR